MSIHRQTTRIGVVDIGSNTVKVSVYACRQGTEPVRLADDADTVRIGYRVTETGVIADDRLARLVECLQRYETRARELGATEFLAVATQAFRVASNTSDVIARIERDTAWRVRVIDADEETRLTIEGARPWIVSGDRSVVADIGGASSEIIAVSPGGAVVAAASVPIGSGMLFDRYIATSPPPPGSLDHTRDVALEAIDQAGIAQSATDHLLLPGGTGYYLKLLLDSLQPGAAFTPDALSAVQHWLSTRHAVETMERIPVQLDRAQVLPASLAVVEALVLRLHPSDISAIPSGIREGVARMYCSHR